jgi:hypothetical protein
MAARRIASALAELDPARRALLDLSLRRGQSDSELAELAGAEPADIARWRDQALEQIASDAGLDGDELEHQLLVAPDRDWLGGGTGPSRRPRPPLRWLGAAVLAVAAITAGILLAVRSDSSAPEDAPSPPLDVPNEAGVQPQPGEPDSPGVETAPEPADAPPRIAVAPLPGVRTPGGVTVSVHRSTGARSIEARLRGLPNPSGGYELWLYDSRRDSVRLGHLDSGSGRIRARLPRRAARYRFLDLSREPKPADARHSRRSLFRTRLRRVLNPRVANGSQR